VRLALRRVDEWVEIVVEDEGVGIDAALLPQVFELFVQGRQSIDRRSGGLGLGLAIVRTLVQLHGGTVSAHSEGPGRGSRFTVRLPASAGVAVPTRAPALSIPVAQGQRRILLVDDNVDAAVTMAELLGNFGFDVKCAHDADGAFETLRAFDAELALLDIGLPLVDGYELARRLRRDPAAQGLKLVALTGYGRENDREQALAAGFDGHLVKPVPVQSLLEMIGKLSPPASPSGTHPSRSA
jgi:CheY-like chemotaxis protein